MFFGDETKEALEVFRNYLIETRESLGVNYMKRIQCYGYEELLIYFMFHALARNTSDLSKSELEMMKEFLSKEELI